MKRSAATDRQDEVAASAGIRLKWWLLRAPAEKEIAAILTQPIIWQERPPSEDLTVCRSANENAGQRSVHSHVTTLTSSQLPSATAVYSQKKKSVVDLTQKMATTYFLERCRGKHTA